MHFTPKKCYADIPFVAVNMIFTFLFITTSFHPERRKAIHISNGANHLRYRLIMISREVTKLNDTMAQKRLFSFSFHHNQMIMVL
jgi:hypothetical protein